MFVGMNELELVEKDPRQGLKVVEPVFQPAPQLFH
jgi:hypothetical protein